MTRSSGTVVFSHGKESGPWGSKISAMAAGVRTPGWAAESVDYRGLDDPGDRVRKLIGVGKELGEPLVLVGSSMGGHVAAAAASRLGARGLFLLAPAFYMAGYEEYTPQDVACPTPLVHGRHDVLGPGENNIRLGGRHQAAPHPLNSHPQPEERLRADFSLLPALLYPPP